MISAYNRRPTIRGKVHETLKNSVPPAFIEWAEPKSASRKIAMTMIGIIPILAMLLLPFMEITEGNVGEAEIVQVGVGDVLTSLITGEAITAEVLTETDSGIAVTVEKPVGEIMAERLFYEDYQIDDFTAKFAGFDVIFTVLAAVMALSLILLLMSVAVCVTHARAPLAYAGFALAVLAPIMMLGVSVALNSMADGAKITSFTLYAGAALTASILALVYCVKYPASTDIKGRRNSFFSAAVTAFVPVKGDGVIEALRKTIFTVALICFFYFGTSLAIDLFSEAKSGLEQKLHIDMIGQRVNPDDPIHNDFASQPVKPLPDYLALYKKNNDMVGYIRIGDTKVDYPVVQTSDNDYYLKHSFEKEVSSGGAIFADYRNKFDELELSDNTILLGHNIMTGNYFASLSNYYTTTTGFKSNDLSHYKKYPVIQFDTLYKKMNWKIFAVGLYNTQEHDGEVYKYHNIHEFEDKDDFHDFIFEVMDRSVLFTDVDLQYGDSILTLSTCYFPMGKNVDTRCVIFARKVRPGESSTVDVSKASFNNQVKRFTREANVMGSLWPGHTVWDYKEYLNDYEGTR